MLNIYRPQSCILGLRYRFPARITSFSSGLGPILPPAVGAEESHSPLPPPPHTPPPHPLLFPSPPVSPSPYYLLFFPSTARDRTRDDRGVSTGHSDPLLPLFSQWLRSWYIPPLPQSPPILCCCSQDLHSCPSRALTVEPYKVLLHWTIVGEKPVWMLFCLILHLFFHSSRLDFVCLWVSLFLLPAYLLAFSGLACEFLCSAFLLSLQAFQPRVNPLYVL